MSGPDIARSQKSRRLLIAFSALVALLTVAGAVSFVRYARRHALDPRLVAVAPFDILVPGLEAWRVRLAEGLTEQLGAARAVPQTVVRERWRGMSRPEIAALDLARRTSAGLAVYGRLDPVADSRDSVRVRMIVIDAGSGRVLVNSDHLWSSADLRNLPRALAEHVPEQAP